MKPRISSFVSKPYIFSYTHLYFWKTQPKLKINTQSNFCNIVLQIMSLFIKKYSRFAFRRPACCLFETVSNHRVFFLILHFNYTSSWIADELYHIRYMSELVTYRTTQYTKCEQNAMVCDVVARYFFKLSAGLWLKPKFNVFLIVYFSGTYKSK